MILEHLTALMAALVAKGWPALSPWWADALTRFYSSGRRQLVLRVGRRGGKSSSLCRVAVVEALFGEHEVPPGDLGVVAIISVSRDEASQRLRTIKAILDALSVPYKPIEGGIELVGRAVAFKVFAASVAGVSGFTTICAICDEVAKWRDSDSGANPAKEVLASLRPTMATQANARIFLSSSPLGLDDAHAQAFDAGETSFQRVAHAPTWIANPSVTEEQTRALEPDDRVWRREYAAIPQASVLSAFDVEAVERAFTHDPTGADYADASLVIDPSSGRGDAFTFAVARWCFPLQRRFLTARKYVGRGIWCNEDVLDRNGRPVLDPSYEPGVHDRPFIRFCAIGGFEGGFWHLGGAEVVAKIAAVAKHHGARIVFGDQREQLMLTSAFAEHRLTYMPIAWTAQNKPPAVERVRSWMRDGQLSLEPCEKLRAELLNFEEKVTPTGQLTFSGRGRRHDDFVALLVTAAMADAEGWIPSSPVALARQREEDRRWLQIKAQLPRM